MNETSISLTFQDVNDRDLALRYRVPAVPRVGEHFYMRDQLYLVTRVVWALPKRPGCETEIDVYVRVEPVPRHTDAQEPKEGA